MLVVTFLIVFFFVPSGFLFVLVALLFVVFSVRLVFFSLTPFFNLHHLSSYCELL